MHIRQIRNATLLISIAERHILVDPMLCDSGAMPGFKVFGGGRRRNPLVDMPDGTSELLDLVTDVVVTHEHPDHFDQRALGWARERELPVWCNAMDRRSLTRKGLQTRAIEEGSLARCEVVRSRHGRGLLGWLMGPVAGYYLEFAGEPSLYLVGDSVLTDAVTGAVERLQPDIVVAPAGAANVGLGGDILFSLDELVYLAQRAPKTVIFNHLEALDHCPTTRAALAERMRDEGLSDRVHIPADGEVRVYEAGSSSSLTELRSSSERPGFQKWVTEKFSGTTA